MTEDVFVLPTTFAQQRLWFLDQLEPESAFYNIAAAVRLEGALDVSALGQSLDEVVRRHETLRTRFEVFDGVPAQVILPALTLVLPLRDIQHLSQAEREAEALRFVAEEARRPFSLAAAPLLRATLLRLRPDEHILTLTMHHIISDGWSVGLLVREIAALYEAFHAGHPSPLPDLTIQYADFAHWEQNRLGGEALDEQLSYWERKLAGQLPLLELLPDHPRPRVPSRRGRQHHFTLHAELTRSLATLARREGATLFMTLLAAFKVLLQRHTGQTDVLVGVPNANRNQAEVEGLIGLFVNTLVMRTDLSGKPSFRVLLRRVRETVLEADAHREVPFEKLVEKLRPERSLGHNPLFQHMFLYQGAGLPPLELPGLKLSLLDVDAGTAKFDFLLSLHETPEGLACSIQYDTDLYDPSTIERLAGHYSRLLESAAADPDLPVSLLPMLSPAEEREILIEFNDTSREGVPEKCLHELFAEQAARTPHAVAVVGADMRLTYGELEERANRLAHYLRDMSVGPESLVGVMLERGSHAVVALLAVLKAGGAYVPLDPQYPEARLSFMLADSRASLLLTQASLAEHARAALRSAAEEDAGSPSVSGAQVVLLEAVGAEIARRTATSPPAAVGSQNLAYIIYTSGSTGRPKGIAIAHRSAVTMVHWAQQCFAPEHLAGVLASTSFCFDLSIFELFVPLSVGGKVILADNALQLPELEAADEVTLVNTVPSAMGELLRLGGVPASVRVVNLAGEPLPLALVEQVYEQTRAGEVWNLYGPSEDTTYSTYALIPRGAGRAPAIGRPVTNSQAYVLDAEMRPVPLGVAGELWLGGEGLARAYLNRPGLTAERFVPHPFAAQPGARLYRTGDLARFLHNGELEFLGRIDEQVKVRGYRIEPGEIEAALRRHPHVADCVVLVRDYAQAEGSRLVAYVVVRGGGGLAAREGGETAHAQLRNHLGERLPSYMIPAAFVTLDAIPLMPNGKVDRRALPAPESVHAGERDDYLAPRSPEEEIVAGIWQEVLKVERVGLRDDFFELGGHSLLATQAVTRLREAFRLDLPLRRIFEHPTIEALSAHLRVGPDGAGQSAPPLIEPRPPGEEPELSFAQQRLWILQQLDPNSHAFNLPIAVRLDGALDVRALERTLGEVVSRHEVLRTSFRSSGGRAVQVIAQPAEFTLPIVDLGELPEGEREAAARSLAAEEARRPFDLRSGPMLRASLLRLGEREHVLLLTMHHIVSDAWSTGVLMAELGTLYRDFSANRPPSLAPLPVQYADYAAWQHGWLQGEVLERQLAYWRGRFKDGLPALNLPTDREPPPQQSIRGAAHVFNPSQELSDSLRVLSRRQGVTPFMLLLAAFKVLLSHYSDQTDIIIGVNVAGRTRPETERMIGFFVNLLALRTDLSGDPKFTEVLSRVRDTALGAYAHQDVPFQKLLEELKVERGQARAPIQVAFTFDNTPRETIDLPGLSLRPLDAEMETTRMELVLALSDRLRGFAGSIQYSTDIFNASTIARMAEDYETLLSLVVEQPWASLSDLRAALAEADRGRQDDRRKDFKETRGRRLREARLKRLSQRLAEGELIR
jgi:amino acid adenylation domain-containing protein